MKLIDEIRQIEAELQCKLPKQVAIGVLMVKVLRRIATVLEEMHNESKY